jgi:cell division septation protein DedD
MMEQGSVRNLEQIQENDGESRTPRGVTILLVALGGACIVFAGLAIGGRRSAPLAQKVDPLGELVSAQAKIGPGAAPKATDLSTRDVTFPGILSDEGSPTTALAAVKGGAAKPPTTGAPGSTAAPLADPTAAISLNVRGSDPGSGAASGDRLPVVPLPAQNVLGASPVVTRPRDALTRAASDAAESASGETKAAPAGREGGFQLQVSSFRTQAEADTFSGQLRTRGHKAYVVEAHVPGRGTWYRVRIGPFTSQHSAASYRSGFEGREHVVPFIVPPSK